jgi:hypothetical protein
MAGVHDVLATEDGVWVTCAASDLLLKIGWDGVLLTEWEWRRDPALRSAFGLHQLPPIRRDLDYRDPRVSRREVANTVHLNGVGRSGDGLLLSFGRILPASVYRTRTLEGGSAMFGYLRRGGAAVKGMMGRVASQNADDRVGKIRGSSHAIVRWRDGEQAEIVHLQGGLSVPNHNVLDVHGWLVYNDTNAGEVVARSHDDGSRVAIPIPGAPSFVRGLEHLGGLEFAVGAQHPAAIHLVDLGTARIVDSVELKGGSNETVYGIARVPDHFHPASRLGFELPAVGMARISR